MDNYMVSARKYRPARFTDVVGQEQVSETLRKALSSGHLAQSFLFCGPRGVGKTTCARILAKAINCENPGADREPCGVCASCQAFSTNASFNIFELDAASNNSVDDIRNLVDQVRFPPQTGKYKVYIIDEVHMLSSSAFNAFLKTLEEPPAYAIFILATTEKHKIIPTILSRCQIFDFKRISNSDIVRQLQLICDKEGVQAEPSALHTIALKADGGMRDALSLFDKIVSYAGASLRYQDVIQNLNILDHEYYFRVTEHFVTEDSAGVLKAFDTVIQNGFDGETFILGLSEHFRNLLVSRTPETAQLLDTGDDLKERYLQQSTLLHETYLLNALNLLNQCDVEYKTARNKRLHVEMALLKLCFLNTQIENTVAVLLGEKKKLSELLEYFRNRPKHSVSGLVSGFPPSGLQITEKPEPPANPPAPAPVPAEKPKQPDPEIVLTVEPAPTVVAEPTPSKKKILPGRSSIGSLLKEVNEEIQIRTEAVQKLELNAETLPDLWKAFLDDIRHKAQPSFLSVAESQQPELQAETIIFSVPNNISQEMLQLHKTEIAEFFIARTTAKVQLEFQLTRKTEPGRGFRSQKERLREMAQANDAVNKLIQKFDLNLD